MTTNGFRTFLEQEIARCSGGRTLVLCPWDLDPLPPGAWQVSAPDGIGATPGNGREFALAITAGLLEQLAPEDGGALLATLRDLQARRVLAVVPASPAPGHRSAWPLERMLAHGLEARGHLGDGDDGLAVYGFDIDHYKRTPDWLNARHWANPENWDRFRW